ncbi:MAG: hypothetical protein DHS20C04_29600 [Hyphococcus sp.]|nr:MAG: hypothetical protein DHS20C04_29600 [Marinicaulis sp.]
MGWLDRFRASNHRFALRIFEWRWFRIYTFAIIGLVFIRNYGVENNPHLFGFLLRIPEFVIIILIFSVVYPWYVLVFTPKKSRAILEDDSEN